MYKMKFIHNTSLCIRHGKTLIKKPVHIEEHVRNVGKTEFEPVPRSVSAVPTSIRRFSVHNIFVVRATYNCS